MAASVIAQASAQNDTKLTETALRIAGSLFLSFAMCLVLDDELWTFSVCVVKPTVRETSFAKRSIAPYSGALGCYL